MEIQIELVRDLIPPSGAPGSSAAGQAGAVLVFEGVVRDTESGHRIAALDYEAYEPMAASEMRRILNDLGRRHPCLAVRVVHRLGRIPVGETAIRVEVVSAHRQEGIALLEAFMNQLKQDVPIWKSRAVAPA